MIISNNTSTVRKATTSAKQIAKSIKNSKNDINNTQ